MGQLKITDTQYFMMNNDHSSPYNLFIYKITFGSTSVNWAKTMICPSGSWTAGFWESILSSDSTKIYSLFTYGSSNYFYFTTFANSDGSILIRGSFNNFKWSSINYSINRLIYWILFINESDLLAFYISLNYSIDL